MSEATSRTQGEKVSRDLAQQIRGVALCMRGSGIVLSMDRPARHHNLIHALAEWAGREVTHDKFLQGFLTMSGKFITREAAAGLMGREGKLFSEDLW